ncbi:MAG: transcriptional repressor [Agriterribacter sp.]
MPFDFVTFFKKRKMHATPVRRALLTALINHKGTLTHKEISAMLAITFDRVTIYRTLDIFLRENIIHALPGLRSNICYVLAKEAIQSSTQYYKKHLHFLCRVCKKTICLESIPVPTIKLPQGFTGTDIDVVVKGVCINCKKDPEN